MRDPQRRRHTRSATRAALVAAAALAALAAPSIAAGGAGATATGAQLSASAAPTKAVFGTSVVVSGTLAEGGAGVLGATLALQADAYPFLGWATVAHTTTGSGGSFVFSGLSADENVRLRVVREEPVLGVAGVQPSSSAVMSVYVDPHAILKTRSLGPGRVQLTLRLAHTTAGGGDRRGSIMASWFAAARGTRVFRLVASTPTREIAPGLTFASAVINPPARRFVYRVCLNPPWERAMGTATGHGRCPTASYTVAHDVR